MDYSDRASIDAAVKAEIAAAEALTAFEINGTTPLGGSARDAADMLTSQAHAMLLVYESALESSQVVNDLVAKSGDRQAECVFGMLRPSIHASAIRGVASLVALARFFADAEHSKRRLDLRREERRREAA